MDVCFSPWRRAGSIARLAGEGYSFGWQGKRYPLRICSGESLYDVAWPVARGSRRTFHDSLYLALAMSNGCPLVTAELRFYHAVKDIPWGQSCLWVEDVP